MQTYGTDEPPASPVMKLLTLAFASLCFCNPINAEDALMPDGRSSDGQIEVRVFREAKSDDAASDYSVRICSVGGTTAPFLVADIGGHLDYTSAIDRDRAFWHGSSQFVAITDQGTRHSVELSLFAIIEGKVERLNLPDYVQNALGRAHAAETDFACVSTVKRWDGDDLVLDLYFTANRRHSYSCEVVLHLYHGGYTAPSVRLKSVSDLKEDEG